MHSFKTLVYAHDSSWLLELLQINSEEEQIKFVLNVVRCSPCQYSPCAVLVFQSEQLTDGSWSDTRKTF